MHLPGVVHTARHGKTCYDTVGSIRAYSYTRNRHTRTRACFIADPLQAAKNGLPCRAKSLRWRSLCRCLADLCSLEWIAIFYLIFSLYLPQGNQRKIRSSSALRSTTNPTSILVLRSAYGVNASAADSGPSAISARRRGWVWASRRRPLPASLNGFGDGGLVERLLNRVKCSVLVRQLGHASASEKGVWETYSH